jgi:hypothetical protein
MAEIFERMLLEVDGFLMGASKVHDTLQRIARRLSELNVDFALAGGLAVGLRGHLRVTVDVDILLTARGLERFKAASLGGGYVEKFPGSRGVKDAQTGVNIDFLVSGGFPGDGCRNRCGFPTRSPFRWETVRTGFSICELSSS